VERDRLFRKFKRECWLILAVLGIASFFLMRPDFTLGVLMGGFLAIANFAALQHTVRRAFNPGGAVVFNKKAIVLKYYLRLFVLGLLIYMLVTRDLVNPLGLAVGLSVIVIDIVCYGVRSAWKSSIGEAT